MVKTFISFYQCFSMPFTKKLLNWFNVSKIAPELGYLATLEIFSLFQWKRLKNENLSKVATGKFNLNKFCLDLSNVCFE